MTARKAEPKATPWKKPKAVARKRPDPRRPQLLKCLRCRGIGYIPDYKAALPTASVCPDCKGKGERMVNMRIY